MAEKKKDDKPKTPEEMNSEELGEFIKSGGQPVSKETVKGDTKEKKEEAKVEEKKEETLIGGKFKTVDDMVKSYGEAEKKISSQGEELSRAKKQAEKLNQTLSRIGVQLDENGNPIIPQAQPPMGDPLEQLRPYFPGLDDQSLQSLLGLNALMINAALENYRKDEEKRLKPVFEIKFEKDVEKQKNTVKGKYQDYDQFASEVDETLVKLPPEIRAKEGSVETIFLTVRGSHTPELLEKAKQGVLQQTKTIESKKEESFVESGGKSSIGTSPVDVNNMTSDELAKFIKKHPDYGKK